MSWVIYALGAIVAVAISDLFRKLGSNLKDPFFSNMIFQLGSITTAVILYLLFSRRLEGNPKGMLYALIGGLLISIFTTFTFKALADGPGVSTVIPVVRIGGVLLVAILGILIFREKLTAHIVFGILFSMIGVYLLLSNK